MARGQVNSLGYGKNDEDWTIRSEASDQVTRDAEEERSETRWQWAFRQKSLRYSPARARACPEMKSLICDGLELGEPAFQRLVGPTGSLRLNLTQHGKTYQVQT